MKRGFHGQARCERRLFLIAEIVSLMSLVPPLVWSASREQIARSTLGTVEIHIHI